MRVAVISIYSFPKGLAPTNRILAYSKGLVLNGADVCVYMPFPTDRMQGNTLPDTGNCENINYVYTSGRYKSNSKIIRGLATFLGIRKITGYVKSFIKIVQDARSSPISVLIISTDNIVSLFVFSLLARRIGAKSIFIFDEYPIPIRHKLKNKIPFWKESLYKIALKNVDAYISISETLKNYYSQLVNKPSFILSGITDISRFDIIDKLESNNWPPYLCYMGNMELAKDNVDNIIRAFDLIKDKYPDFELHLYGAPSLQNRITIASLIKELNLCNKVFLKGTVDFDKVPKLLVGAKILVSSQPNTIRASGGFPTKLGEYLASNVPTLLTDVGENSRYVKDGVHVFFVEPNNHYRYAQKLEYILDNYQEAKEIAQKGRQFIMDNFSNLTKGKELISFFYGISNETSSCTGFSI